MNNNYGHIMALIYDVGMNNGEDSAFYLNKGHTVIAIEAIPELVEAAMNRFEEMARSGRFTALNVAIAENASERDFWICDDLSAFSSLHRPLANRDGRKHHAIRIKCIRFGDILARFGVPYYLKIDIEGSDAFCLKDLDRNNLPPFVSVEAGCEGNEALSSGEDGVDHLTNLNHLYRCGYNRFKLVSQHSLLPISHSNLESAADPEYRQMVRDQIEKDIGWRFPHGSSGPWGNEIPGPWMNYSEAREVYLACREAFFLNYKDARFHMFWFWFDWHATTLQS
jgi:FkbM family methyltransferase